MKKVFLAFAISCGTLVTAAQAKAGYDYNKQCSFRQAEESGNLNPVRRGELKKLTPLEKQQVIAVARGIEDGGAIASAEQAVELLINSSEGGEVYINYYNYQGLRFTGVEYYPGGNPVGTFFATGATEVIGLQEDSDYICN